MIDVGTKNDLIMGIAGGGGGLILLILLGFSICYCCPRPASTQTLKASDFLKIGLPNMTSRSSSKSRTGPSVHIIGPDEDFRQI